MFTLIVTGPSYPTGTGVTFTIEDGIIISDNPQTIDDLLPGSYTIEGDSPGEEWAVEILTSPVEVASLATVTVAYTYLTVEDAVESLITDVEDLDLPGGTANSLSNKLDNALNTLADGNDSNDIAAINALEAFINQVEAQIGKKISPEDGELLIEQAQEIIDWLSG